MSNAPAPSLSRLQISLLYLAWLAVLAYCVYGALGGEVVVPGRGNSSAVRGWAAWLVCVVPILLIVGAAIHWEPSINLPKRIRAVLDFAMLLPVMLVLFIALRYGPNG